MATDLRYEKERICKGSIRYKLADLEASGPGPITIYMPNDMFESQEKAPKTILVKFTYDK